MDTNNRMNFNLETSFTDGELIEVNNVDNIAILPSVFQADDNGKRLELLNYCIAIFYSKIILSCKYKEVNFSQ